MPDTSAATGTPTIAESSDEYTSALVVDHERLQQRLDKLDERAKWHRRLILAFGLGASIAMAVTILACAGDSPWVARILAATIAAPLGVSARFFQNRYENDLRGQDQVLEALLRATKGPRRKNATSNARRLRSCPQNGLGRSPLRGSYEPSTSPKVPIEH